jgi:hypothetical protein
MRSRHSDSCPSDYSRRKDWTIDRLSMLASIFTIDTCAYAVMTAYAEHPSLLNG